MSATGNRERVALIDGTGLLYRAWHAMPGDLKTTSGIPTGAVFGFATMFRKLSLGRHPRFGAVVFDAGGKNWRHELFPGYKAHRPPMPEALRQQIPLVEELVAAHGYPVVRRPGVEADDVIAALAHLALADKHEVWIVSGDKDFAQLVGPSVSLYDSTAEIKYDSTLVRKKWGVPPELFADWLTLVGDAADGVPGSPGFGPKSAAEALLRFGGLDALLLARITLPSRLQAGLDPDAVRISRALVAFKVDVDVPAIADLRLPDADVDRLNAVYRRLEFHRFLAPEPARRAAPAQHWVCDTPDAVDAALANECNGEVALQVVFEWTGHLRGEVLALGVSPSSGRAICVPGTLLSRAKPWLEDPSRPKVLHEAKLATVALARYGVTLRGVVGDTAIASYLLDPTLCVPHRLEQCAREWLHRAIQPVAAMVGTGGNVRKFADLPVGRLAAYATHLADTVGDLWRELKPRLLNAGLYGRLMDVELPVSAVIADMERQGIGLDLAVVNQLGARLAVDRDIITTRLHNQAGRTFNPGSLRQLETILYADLGLPVKRKTKTGYATDAATLRRLRKYAPTFIDDLLAWREAAKLIDATTEVLRESVFPDGRIRATWQQTVGAAGRLITTQPDLQRTPVGDDVRSAFVASPGCVLIGADWSQIELRLLAHLSADPTLVATYVAGDDVHRRTAASLFGISENSVDHDQRNVGKTVNFATLYGQGAAALAEQLGVAPPTARAFIEAFFAAWPTIRQWKERTIANAVATGGVRTLLGWWRRIPELVSNDADERAYGERIAVNTSVQGSGADLCKLAMLGIQRDLLSSALHANLVLSIHDELVYEAPVDEIDATVSIVRKQMENVVQLSVPLRVDIGVGATWAACHTK